MRAHYALLMGNNEGSLCPLHVKIQIFQLSVIVLDNSSSHFLEMTMLVRKVGTLIHGEGGGSVVECRTPEREVRGSRPTATVLCPWARHFTPWKYWLITQEAMAPSRHDWKIVDWDVKPQHNQPTNPDSLKEEADLPKRIAEVWKRINKSRFWHMEGIVTPHGLHCRECDATYPHSGWVSMSTQQISVIISRKWEPELPKNNLWK